MDTLANIVGMLAWPVTTIIVVMLMRSPLSELIPTLKKLKYKDIEVEFEREANKILSEAERDLPEIQEKPKPRPETEDSGIRLSRRRLEPTQQILESWHSLELEIRAIAKDKNIDVGHSIRSLISGLESNGLISKEIAKVTLDLAALKNKVTHTDEEIITYDVSAAFSSSVQRVISAMREENA